ncbi:S1 family peptidase [Flavobacterium sp. TBRC 19031]|uniref:S1 family peptidase n=1 Tax=Flavobacterium mekongense TaxID=3379707 RepID=UPI00399A7C0B
MPPTSGSISLTNERVASFPLYHPNIPSNATNFTILPKDDFYLGIMDNQRIIDDGLFGFYPDLVQTDSPLQLFDPNNRTLADQTWSNANVGDVVIAIGYPNDRVTYPNGAVSSGRIYSDSEAENIIQLLNQSMDTEGNIPYNPQVEFLANIHAVSGMSGGGVFNENGQLLGIMVRATELNGQPILRVVRINYIVQKLTLFFDSLSPSDKVKIEPFINGELN